MTDKSKIFYIENGEGDSFDLKPLIEVAKKDGITINQVPQIPDLTLLEKSPSILLVSLDFYKNNHLELDEIRENSFLILITDKKDEDKLDFDGIINLNQNPAEGLTWLKTLQVFSKNYTLEKIERLYQLTSSKLEKIKQIHEKVVPIRIEKGKTLAVTSKYAAGTKRGGDFYDCVIDDKNLFLMMCSTSSYIASTVITSHFSKFQNASATRDKYEDLLEDFINECRDLELISRNNPDSLEVLILSVDLKRLEYFGYQFGHFSTLGTNLNNSLEPNEYPLNENYIEESYINGKLLPGERLCLLSPGIFKNMNSGMMKNKDFESLTSKDFLNNVFFNLKKENDFNDFLSYDSTAVIIEVSPNVLVQI